MLNCYTFVVVVVVAAVDVAVVVVVVVVVVAAVTIAGLENSTRPLVFTSASGCRASENFDISSENLNFSHRCE